LVVRSFLQPPVNTTNSAAMAGNNNRFELMITFMIYLILTNLSHLPLSHLPCHGVLIILLSLHGFSI
jgi:hypothetical protein